VESPISMRCEQGMEEKGTRNRSLEKVRARFHIILAGALGSRWMVRSPGAHFIVCNAGPWKHEGTEALRCERGLRLGLGTDDLEVETDQTGINLPVHCSAKLVFGRVDSQSHYASPRRGDRSMNRLPCLA